MDIVLEFKTTVSGKSFRQNVPCKLDRVNEIIKSYKNYGWSLIGDEPKVVKCERYSCLYLTDEEHVKICPGSVSFRDVPYERSVIIP